MISRLTYRNYLTLISMFRCSVTLGRRSLLLFNTFTRSSNSPLSISQSTLPSRTMCSTDEHFQFTVSYVTTPDEKTAKEIAHKLVQNKLAACVNVLPQITSIYKWEEKVNEDSEAMMIIKTTAEKTEALIKFVKENHPYSVAEVISMPIVKGNDPYLEWVRKSVTDGE